MKKAFGMFFALFFSNASLDYIYVVYSFIYLLLLGRILQNSEHFSIHYSYIHIIKQHIVARVFFPVPIPEMEFLYFRKTVIRKAVSPSFLNSFLDYAF